MSEGKDGRDTATTVNRGESGSGAAMSSAVNEDRGEVALPPTENEGEEKAVTTPAVGEGQGMDPVSPVMSYEPGTDHIELYLSDDEIKYEGKGKGRTESFSHLPVRGQSAPSTAPSTRPTSQVPDDSALSTAPSTRPNSQVPAPTARPTSQVPNDPGPSTAPITKPVSQVQANQETSMADSTSSATEEKEGSAATTASDDSEVNTGQGDSTAMATQADSEPANGQGSSTSATSQVDSPAIPAHDATLSHTAQSTSGAIESHDKVPNKNISPENDCGCKVIRDDTGKQRLQACTRHRPNPERMGHLLAQKPLGVSTNLPRGTRNLSVYTPQASRDDESSPREPPKVTPTEGRNVVKVSEDSPTFLGPMYFERATAPIGQPNRLTTRPPQPAVPLNWKSFGSMSNSKDSTSKASGPKALDPVTARNTSNPPQVNDDASGSQAKQPQKLGAVEGQDLGSGLPKGEQCTGDKATTEPKPVEGNGDEISYNNSGPPRTVNCSPHHRGEIAPKSILKKTPGTAAEARQAEGGMSSMTPVDQGEDSEEPDPNGGVKLFHAALAKIKACNTSKAVNEVSAIPSAEDQSGGAPTPRLTMEMKTEKNTKANTPPLVADSEDENTDRAGKKICPRLSKCNFL